MGFYMLLENNRGAKRICVSPISGEVWEDQSVSGLTDNSQSQKEEICLNMLWLGEMHTFCLCTENTEP